MSATSVLPFSKSIAALKPLCLAALLCAAGAAQASIQVYTSEADFLAAVSAPGVDRFDDLGNVQYSPRFTRSAGDYSYQASTYGALWGAGTAADHWLSNNSPHDSIVFDHFSTGISAFGGNFFASDVDGQFVDGSVTLSASDGSTFTYTLDHAGTASFLGFVSTSTLDAVALGVGYDSGYWPTVNNLVLAVPEPGSYAMLLAGLGFVGVASRRRSRTRG